MDEFRVNEERSCPKCQGKMELGFTPESLASVLGLDNKAYQEYWVPGPADWSGGKLTVPKEQLDASIAITKLRCEQCGYLESYANG